MREIVTYKRYSLDFYEALGEKAQEKVDYALMLLKAQNRLSTRFVKHLEDGIFELRAIFGNNSYRILFFYDEGNIVVLCNAFQKKTQKTPRAEIEQAKRLRTDYYENKK